MSPLHHRHLGVGAIRVLDVLEAREGGFPGARIGRSRPRVPSLRDQVPTIVILRVRLPLFWVFASTVTV